jgi:hypothetical protein
VFASLRLWAPFSSPVGSIVGLIGVYLIAALHPFECEPRSTRRRGYPAAPGHFPISDSRTLAAPGWVVAARRLRLLLMHLRVRPASLNQRGAAHIMTLSRDTQYRNFTVARR